MQFRANKQSQDQPVAGLSVSDKFSACTPSALAHQEHASTPQLSHAAFV